MRYISLPLLIPALASIGHAQGLMQAVGTPGIGQPNITVCNTNAAANYCAIEFVPVGSHTLSTIGLQIGSIAGSLGPNDLELDVYSDSGAQVPNVSLGVGYTSTTITQNSSLWYTWSGYTGTLTSGAMYWLVLKNKNAAPTANYAVLKSWPIQVAAPMPLITGSHTQVLEGMAATYNGTAWSSSASIGVFKIYYSDNGTYEGYPLSGYNIDSTNTVYSGAAIGSLFTSPSVAMSVSCIAMPTFAKIGTPTGTPQFQIYAGSSGTLNLLGTTDPVPSFNNSSYPVTACFESPVIVPANTTIRVVMSETTGADTSVNAYRTYYITYDSSAGSPQLTPFSGTLQETYCPSSGGCTAASRWTQTNYRFVPFELLLTTGAEFSHPQSGSVN